MPDYSAGKIYKITNPADGKLYVGSTTEKYLSVRLNYHRHMAPKKADRTFYKHMLDLGPKQFSITLVEAFPCTARSELESREQHWIAQLGAGLNSRKAGMRVREDPKKYFAEHHAERKTNEAYRTKRAAYRAEKTEEHSIRAAEKIACGCGSSHSRGGKSRHLKSAKHAAWMTEQ